MARVVTDLYAGAPQVPGRHATPQQTGWAVTIAFVIINGTVLFWSKLLLITYLYELSLAPEKVLKYFQHGLRVDSTKDLTISSTCFCWIEHLTLTMLCRFFCWEQMVHIRYPFFLYVHGIHNICLFSQF
jgi:hypothetical protein